MSGVNDTRLVANRMCLSCGWRWFQRVLEETCPCPACGSTNVKADWED